MKIAYLGPAGSFSHHVAKTAFPHADWQDYQTITEVMQAYEAQEVDFAVVPVENSIEGSVHETFDYLFHQGELQVVAELIHPIKQQLLGRITDLPIERILSHPQALAQGRRYLEEHFPGVQFEVTASTSYAARRVAEETEHSWAAIAPEAAAEEYGLQVLAKDIQEMEENYTRFWLLGHSSPVFSFEKEEKKLSLALTLPDNLPGALYKGLSVFAWRGLDLTKIESRPLKTALGEYYFIIDVVDQESTLHYALEELSSLGISYKVLGNYQVYRV